MTEEVNPCFPPSLTCRSWPKERLVASRIILSTTKNKSASAGLCWDKWYDWFGVPEFALYLSVNNSSYFRNPKFCLSQGVFIFFPQKQAKSSLQNWHPECSRSQLQPWGYKSCCSCSKVNYFKAFQLSAWNCHFKKHCFGLLLEKSETSVGQYSMTLDWTVWSLLSLCYTKLLALTTSSVLKIPTRDYAFTMLTYWNSSRMANTPPWSLLSLAALLVQQLLLWLSDPRSISPTSPTSGRELGNICIFPHNGKIVIFRE